MTTDMFIVALWEWFWNSVYTILVHSITLVCVWADLRISSFPFSTHNKGTQNIQFHQTFPTVSTVFRFSIPQIFLSLNKRQRERGGGEGNKNDCFSSMFWQVGAQACSTRWCKLLSIYAVLWFEEPFKHLKVQFTQKRKFIYSPHVVLNLHLSSIKHKSRC